MSFLDDKFTIYKGTIENDYIIDDDKIKSYRNNLFMNSDNISRSTYDENILNMNVEDLKNIYDKINTKQNIVKSILTYELLNYENDKKINDLSELIEIFRKTMERYQWIVGGYDIEDDEWILCNNISKFCLKPNQIALYNSTGENGYDNSELERFIKMIRNHMRKMTDKYDINYAIVEDKKYDIWWILYVFEEK